VPETAAGLTVMQTLKTHSADLSPGAGPQLNGHLASGAISADDLIRVAIVDDHPIMRDGLVHTFRREFGFEVVGQGGTGAEAIEIAETLLPDIIFIDINMPGDGVTATRVISHSCPAVRIVVLTGYDGEQFVVEALRAGASGFIVKGISAGELLQTARAVHKGESYVTPALAAKLLGMRETGAARARPATKVVDLTSREEQILRGVCEGMSNKQIGESISLSEKTVKHYMTNILQKLHARNRLEAALIGKEHLR
jgi:two-component system, NarL family, nitrate/nitrite response regulator NarL